jgi:hypothetical protein
MAGDADIIRCTSPWPGKAAQLLEALATLGPGNWSLETISAAAASGVAPGDAAQILDSLAAANVCALTDDSTWSTQFNHTELLRLSTLLRGAEHFRRLRTDVANLELAVTLPMTPSVLEQHLPGAPGRPGGYIDTPAAFLRVASAAQERFVVLSPFVNRSGFEWLRSLMSRVNGRAQKILVLRDISLYAVDLAVHHRDWLQALGVSILDYNLSHPAEARRMLPIETFHAKIVLADNRLAYIGSANFLGSGSGTSLEAGVLVDGRAAAQVARLVDGIVRAARHV